MPRLPTTFEGLEQLGYNYSGSGYCRKCKKRILWYRTPRGKLMPFDENPENAEPHFATCPFARDFKRED